MEQIRYLDSKRFKEFLRKEALKQNTSINRLIQDSLRAYFNKEKDFKK
jgi:nucleoid-associated protein YejK